MECAYDIFDDNKLILFNKVCLYLRVATTFDLTTVNGKELDSNIMKGERSQSPMFSEYAYTWPNVPSPTKAEIQIWYKTLATMFAITQNDANLYIGSEFKWDYDSIQNTKWTRGRSGKYMYDREDDTISRRIFLKFPFGLGKIRNRRT